MRIFAPLLTFALLVACGPAPRAPGNTPTSIMPVIGPGGDPTTATDVATLAPKACGDAPLIAAAPATCTRLTGAALSSGAETPATSEAFDGDVCSTWTAGGPAPRFAAIDFGARRLVSGLLLVPETEQPGRMRHVIEASDDGVIFHTLYVVDASMAGGHVYEVKMPTPFSARALRVSTTASPSWVAWREIAPLTCK
ncbi:MAG: hypothetical protein NVSMB47_16830 [Polyangiales bacterium]